MAHNIRVESDRRAPLPELPKGMDRSTRRGQGISRARGSHTRNKKNPGKRTHQGG
jgi:hypothetical protein